MLIAHASDLHGDITPMLDLHRMKGQPDVWVLTGDMFPNKTRGVVAEEIPFQEEWAAANKERLTDLLEGQKVVLVPGNHDYADLAEILRSCGAHVFEVTPEGVEVLGLRWAGFREIPYIMGEWAGETHDFTDLVDRVVATDPDILVTHAPAAGILDIGCQGFNKGINQLTSALSYRMRNVKAHFFGHVHTSGGEHCYDMGILFANGAETCRMFEMDV